MIFSENRYPLFGIMLLHIGRRRGRAEGETHHVTSQIRTTGFVALDPSYIRRSIIEWRRIGIRLPPARPKAMARLFATIFMLIVALAASARAQMTTVPGPGGTPIAPGAPVHGWTPGGISHGGAEVAPGSAARNVPMFRVAPSGALLAPRPDPSVSRDQPTALLPPGCPNDPACAPEIIPHSLILTITSRDTEPAKKPAPDAAIDSIHDLFAALRACWDPPAREQAQEGVQMSVRFSLRRSGDILAPPFVTYTTPGTKADTKQLYRRAIEAALERCAPLPLSKGFAAAIAGQPISIRYVDDRTAEARSPRP